MLSPREISSLRTVYWNMRWYERMYGIGALNAAYREWMQGWLDCCDEAYCKALRDDKCR